jgi:hypothetical protein
MLLRENRPAIFLLYRIGFDSESAIITKERNCKLKFLSEKRRPYRNKLIIIIGHKRPNIRTASSKRSVKIP